MVNMTDIKSSQKALFLRKETLKRGRELLFYAFRDFSRFLGMEAEGKLLRDTFDISEYILRSSSVVTVPGDGFGAPGHIRFSYATNKQNIEKGIKRIKNALKKII